MGRLDRLTPWLKAAAVLAAVVLAAAAVVWVIFNAEIGGETEIETGTTPLTELRSTP